MFTAIYDFTTVYDEIILESLCRYVTSPIPFDKLKNSEMVLRVEETNFTVVASDISIKCLRELIYDRTKHPKSFLKCFKLSSQQYPSLLQIWRAESYELSLSNCLNGLEW